MRTRTFMPFRAGLILLATASCVLALSGPLSAGVTDEAAAPSAIYWTPSPPPRAQYIIDCKIDLKTLRVTGTATIKFTNESRRPIHRIAVNWPTSAGRTLDITMDGSPVLLVEDATRKASAPRVYELPYALDVGKSLALHATFSRRLRGEPSPATLVLTDWYPALWWGFETHADFDVRIDAPPGYVIGSSGLADSESGRLRMRGAAGFGLFLGKGLSVLEGEAGGVKVRCLHTPRGEKCAQLILATALDAIDFYQSWLGFYPHRSLTVIPGMDSPVGGYPVAAGLVTVHGQERLTERPLLHWKWITAHEIGHQYWGEHVLERDSPGWLWIGMGIFADREYVRQRGLGQKQHEELMGRYIRGVRNGTDTTVERSQEELSDLDFDFNNVVVHGKGFSIVSALASVVGDEAFERAYRRALKEFGGRRLGAAEFRGLCEQEGGQDLGWFFDQWVRSNRYLSYRIASKACEPHEAGYRTTVNVESPGTLRMPVPVVAEFEDGTRQRQSTDRLLDTNVLVFQSKTPLLRVSIDPKGELAMVVPPPEALSKSLRQSIQQMAWTDSADEAGGLLAKARRTPLEDAGLYAKLGLSLYEGGRHVEALEAFERGHKKAKANSVYGFVTAAWQGHLLDLMNRRDDALTAYEKALTYPSSMTMRHDQFGITLSHRWIKARIRKPFERE